MPDFFDPKLNKFVVVRDGDLTPTTFDVDPVRHTVTVTFSSSSNPTVTQLFGTVFTVTVNNNPTQTTTVNPALALASGNTGNGPGTLGGFKTATFASTARVNVVIASSQESQAVQESISEGGGTKIEDSDEYNAWLRMMGEVLDNDPVALWRVAGDEGLKLWLLKKAPAAPPKAKPVTPPRGANPAPPDMKIKTGSPNDRSPQETLVDQYFEDYTGAPVNRIIPIAALAAEDVDAEPDDISYLDRDPAVQEQTSDDLRLSTVAWAAPLAALIIPVCKHSKDDRKRLRGNPRVCRLV